MQYLLMILPYYVCPICLSILYKNYEQIRKDLRKRFGRYGVKLWKFYECLPDLSEPGFVVLSFLQLYLANINAAKIIIE